MTLADLRAQATLQEGAFTSWDWMACELEVAELLYALVRAMKPKIVVEAGADPLTVSHGQEADPSYCRVSQDGRQPQRVLRFL